MLSKKQVQHNTILRNINEEEEDESGDDNKLILNIDDISKSVKQENSDKVSELIIKLILKNVPYIVWAYIPYWPQAPGFPSLVRSP